MEQTRITEVFIDGQWVAVDFESLVKGDTFRQTDPEGPVTYEGKTDFVADSSAYYSEFYQEWTIKIKGEDAGVSDGDL
jgi:type 1 glutamine amidotransferase